MLNVKIVVEGGIVQDVFIKDENDNEVPFQLEIEDHDILEDEDHYDCDKCNGIDTD